MGQVTKSTQRVSVEHTAVVQFPPHTMPVQTAPTVVPSTLWNRNIDRNETRNISSLLFLLKSLPLLAVMTKKERNNGIVRGTRTFFCFKIETGCELGGGRAPRWSEGLRCEHGSSSDSVAWLMAKACGLLKVRYRTT
jgi:hypothetical protein